MACLRPDTLFFLGLLQPGSTRMPLLTLLLILHILPEYLFAAESHNFVLLHRLRGDVCTLWTISS